VSDQPSIDEYRRQARTWLDANMTRREPGEVSGVVRSGVQRTREELTAERALQRQVYEAGYAGIAWPTEYGGQGLTHEHARAFAEESMHYRLPDLGMAGGTTFGPCGQTLLAHASPAFLKVHVPRMLAGDELVVQLFSEPGAGSDLAGVTTTAKREGDRWLITGSKIWTSGAEHADYGMCLARTDWDVPKHRGLTWFAVPLRAPGVEVRPIREISGSAEFCQEFLDQVEVSDDDVIGEVNQGWSVAQTMLVAERSAGRDDPVNLPVPKAGALDPALLALLRGADRSKDPIARQTAARIHIVDWARGQLGRRVTDLLLSGAAAATGIAAYWKLAAGIYEPLHARLKMEIGQADAIAWAETSPVGGSTAMTYLNSRVWSIAGGSNEMQRNAISEQVLGLPREPSAERGKTFREAQHDAKNWSSTR
jgi:alkylation response protein AidB-like acyl-CoA dehydrogenase